MKVERHSKIVELIGKYEIETQEELADYLNQSGFNVTQATVSRDIRELKLTKAPSESGKQRYMVLQNNGNFSDKYIRILQDGFLSMDMAQNILVIRTVSGMAMAVAAALDAIRFHEIVGCIAGDDTIMCAVRSVDDTILVMDKLQKLIINGVLEPDSKMPSVRNLAMELSINPGTIQKAYAELERKGFLYTIKGRGNFVTYNEGLYVLKKEEYRGKIDRLLTEAEEIGISRTEMLDSLKEGEK